MNTPDELTLAAAHFEAGNFAGAKVALAKAVAEAPADRAGEVAVAADQLRKAMAPDPWARRLAIAAALVIAALAINYVG